MPSVNPALGVALPLSGSYLPWEDGVVRPYAQGKLLCLLLTLSIPVLSAQAQVPPPSCDGEAVTAALADAAKSRADRKPKAALEHMRKAYALCRDHRILFNRARVLEDMKSYSEAAVWYQAFLDLSVGDPEVGELRTMADNHRKEALKKTQMKAPPKRRKPEVPEPPPVAKGGSPQAGEKVVTAPVPPPPAKQSSPPEQASPPQETTPPPAKQSSPPEQTSPPQETPPPPPAKPSPPPLSPPVHVVARATTDARPIYRRPWFWVTTALGVAAVSGITIGVVLGTRPTRGPQLRPFEP